MGNQNLITHLQHWKCFNDRCNDWHRAVMMTPKGEGCIIAEYPFQNALTALIFGIQIDEKDRGRGFATSLLDEMERLLREQGVHYTVLEWDRKDSPEWVLKWYLRRGYEEIEFSRDRSLLQKNLSQSPNNPDLA